MTRQGSLASRLRNWEGVKSWSNKTTCAAVEATTAAISSSFHCPTRVAASGFARRCTSVAAISAPALRASSSNSASEASKSRSPSTARTSDAASGEPLSEVASRAAVSRASFAAAVNLLRWPVNSTATSTADSCPALTRVIVRSARDASACASTRFTSALLFLSPDWRFGLPQHCRFSHPRRPQLR